MSEVVRVARFQPKTECNFAMWFFPFLESRDTLDEIFAVVVKAADCIQAIENDRLRSGKPKKLGREGGLRTQRESDKASVTV